MMKELDLSGSRVLDSRDIEKRIRELESDIEDGLDTLENAQYELVSLQTIREEFKDHGDWSHGAAVIPEQKWLDYVRDLAMDVGVLSRDDWDRWPLRHIDWQEAADELESDYVSCDAAGTTWRMQSN